MTYFRSLALSTVVLSTPLFGASALAAEQTSPQSPQGEARCQVTETGQDTGPLASSCGECQFGSFPGRILGGVCIPCNF